MTIGDRVLTKRGKGIITRIDDNTYSIPMYFVKLIDGNFTGETICTCTVISEDRNED